MNEQDENRLDDFLRNKLGGYRPEPRQEVWAAIEQRVNKPVSPPQRRLGRWIPVLLSGTVGLLAGWLMEPQFQNKQSTLPAATVEVPALAPTVVAPLGNGGSVSNQASPAADVTVPAAGPLAQAPSLAAPAPAATIPTQTQTPTSQVQMPAVAVVSPVSAVAAPASVVVPPTGAGLPTQGLTPVQSSSVQPATASPVVAVVFANPPVRITPPTLEGLVLAENNVQTTWRDTTASDNMRRIMALQLEKAELTKLQRRADSLIGVLDPVAALAGAPDSVTRQPQVPTRRWSVVASFAPEHTFLGLQAPVADTMMILRRNHEEGRTSFNAALMGEYRINNRWSVGMGVGYSTYGAELRVTNRNTRFDVINDTTLTQTTSVNTVTNVITAVREDTVYYNVPSPVYNGAGQVIGYTSVRTYTINAHTDSVVLTTTDTVHTVKQTITPLLIKHETTTYKVLRPDYHFVTIPLLVRYRLTPEQKGARWWTDMAVGAQFQFFQGGTQLVTADGRTFYTQRVKAHEAPFRPLNVALTGQLAFNYALSSHLSVSVAPAVRWQVQSVYKKETGLKQQPTATGLQLAARWAF